MDSDSTTAEPLNQHKGSPEPVPGRCGRKLPNTRPPRYCKRWPLKGKTACARCGGKTPVGPANHKFKTGYASKYMSVLPRSMEKHFNLKPLQEVASCREEIALVDARTTEILESSRRANPAGSVNNALGRLSVLEQAIGSGNKAQARRAAQNLRTLLSKVAVAASNWEEIRKNLELRDKLVKTEQGYQKLLSDRIVVEQIHMFIQALIREARTLTEDNQKLNAYVLRVLELGRGAIGHALLPDNNTEDEEVLEGELVGKE